MSVTVVTSGGNINVAVSDGSVTVATSNNVGFSDWDLLSAAQGIGYNYPQSTGQTTSYRTGDDAWVESNVFTSAIRSANDLGAKNSLSNFTTLNHNNTFGNTNRFTDISGGQTFSDDYVIDHYTGLGWYRVSQTISTWDDSIDDAQSSTQNSYSDWFVPNLNQILSICDNEEFSVKTNYTPINVSDTAIWTSTTDTSVTTRASRYQSLNRVGVVAKTSTNVYLICRKHY